MMKSDVTRFVNLASIRIERQEGKTEIPREREQCRLNNLHS